MKKAKGLFYVLFLSLFVLLGCSTDEEVPNFELREISGIEYDDEDTPTIYIVNGSDNELTLYKNEAISEIEIVQTSVSFELENVTVTEEQIVLKYDGRLETFKRLSDSAAENEDKAQYYYREVDFSEPVE